MMFFIYIVTPSIFEKMKDINYLDTTSLTIVDATCKIVNNERFIFK